MNRSRLLLLCLAALAVAGFFMWLLYRPGPVVR
jgi:hypothetical protein